MITQKICQNKHFFYLLLFPFLVGLSLPKLSARALENFKKLTNKEELELKYFFESAIKINHLGHVLFFHTKPACLFVINATEEQNLFTIAWNMWKSKEHLFCHPNFIFYEEECENKIYVYFINKQALLFKLSNQEEKLKQIFGESFSIKGLIEKLEQHKFPTLICKDHILTGILLGYGIESSLGYIQYIDPKQQVPSKELTGIFCAEEGKIETIQMDDGVTLCSFNSKVPIHPVAFVGDPDSEEVKNLKKNYSQELEKIEIIYQRKDLLQVCLEKICSQSKGKLSR